METRSKGKKRCLAGESGCREAIGKDGMETRFKAKKRCLAAEGQRYSYQASHELYFPRAIKSGLS